MKSELISGGIFVHVDGQMTFPSPVSDRLSEVEWKMRHAKNEVTENDLLLAASVISAYREIIEHKSQ